MYRLSVLFKDNMVTQNYELMHQDGLVQRITLAAKQI